MLGVHLVLSKTNRIGDTKDNIKCSKVEWILLKE